MRGRGGMSSTAAAAGVCGQGQIPFQRVFGLGQQPWLRGGYEKTATLLILKTRSPQVPPVCPEAIICRLRLQILLLSLGVWFRRRAPRRRPRSASVIIFIVAECQLVHFVIDCTITLRESGQGPCGANGVMPASRGDQSYRAGRRGCVSSELRGLCEPCM